MGPKLASSLSFSSSSNIIIGKGAGTGLTSGGQNTLIGKSAGTTLTTGTANTVIGYNASVSNAGNSIAIGYNASANTGNTVVIGNVIDKVGFGKQPGGAEALAFSANTAYLSSGGVWTNASDRNIKENITPVNSAEVLDKIMQLPITQWNYIKEDDAIKHIGPMAQDFYEAFGLGRDEKTISTIDPAGVALVAIQELNKKQKELNAKINEIADLKTTLEMLVSEVESLKEKVDERDN
ncbi:MAG: tail fiber domain-containing protein [Saprospiraceae bacterium]